MTKQLYILLECFPRLLADNGAIHTLDETVSHGVRSATRTYAYHKKAA